MNIERAYRQNFPVNIRTVARKSNSCFFRQFFVVSFNEVEHDVRRKILIIDDIRRSSSCEVLCSKAGYDGIVAANGWEGLQQATAEQPDVILVDAMMPEMDGLNSSNDSEIDQTQLGKDHHGDDTERRRVPSQSNERRGR